MSKTLLEITQEILSVMTSDEVNSISDSAEAESVANIVIAKFEAMVSNRNWPHLKKLLKLEAYGDNTKPTHIKLPSNVKELVLINYNKSKLGDERLRYDDVKWKDQDAFLRLTNNRNSTSDTIQTVTDPTGIKLLISTNKQPEFFTSFDDETIIMDSFDSEVDDTIHISKIQAYGYVMPTTSFEDGWVPDLPEEAFRALIEEAKSTARFQLDTVNDIKAEQEATRQNRWLSRKSWSVNGGIKYPNYGRKRGR